MKKTILISLLIVCLFGCSRKPAPTIQEVDESELYLVVDTNKLTQYVGNCLNYDIIKDTNGIIPARTMICELLEEPGEVEISLTIASRLDSEITKTFDIKITVLPADEDDDPIIAQPLEPIIGDHYYQCNNWLSKESRFTVGNPNNKEEVYTSIIVKVSEDGKIYLLTEKNASYWWQSDYIQEEAGIFRALGYAQFRSGSYTQLNNDAPFEGYFVIENEKLYYISGEIIHDITENLACPYINE